MQDVLVPQLLDIRTERWGTFVILVAVLTSKKMSIILRGFRLLIFLSLNHKQ